MPRLRGYRERVNGNVWDSFLIRDLIPSARLFGNANIGNLYRCNLQVAGQLATDQEFVVLNWYARSNIHECSLGDEAAAAWHAWQNMTVVSLLVGSRPVVQRPLSDLMGPRGSVYGGLAGNRESVPEAMARAYDREREKLAMQLYKAYSEAQQGSPLGPFPEGIQNPDSPPHGWETWEDLAEKQQAGWLAAADAFRPLYRPVTIPLRQNFTVQVDTAHGELHRLRDAIPTHVPQAMVWIHLDGLLTRHVH